MLWSRDYHFVRISDMLIYVVERNMRHCALILVLAVAFAGSCGQDPAVTAAKKQHT